MTVDIHTMKTRVKHKDKGWGTIVGTFKDVSYA